MRTITESESTPKADGFFMPAEFAPQDRVWMGWPHRTDTWAHGAKPAQKQYAAIARAISEFTPVYMCANQVDYANCKAVFENDENVTVIEMTTDDAWFRDTAATYVINGKGEKRANHWHFNAYGGLVDGLYFPWDKDEQIALKMAELSGCRRYRPDDMILEGGSITVDGEGTLVVTDQCLLSPGRTCSAVLEEEEDPESIWPKFHKKFELGARSFAPTWTSTSRITWVSRRSSGSRRASTPRRPTVISTTLPRSSLRASWPASGPTIPSIRSTSSATLPTRPSPTPLTPRAAR